MNNLIVREYLNGSLFALTLCVLFFVSKFLFDSWRAFGAGWSRQAGVASACAFWWLFLADAIRASFVWVTLRIENAGLASDFLEPWRTAAFMLAAAIAFAATFRLVHVLSPAHWGHRSWLTAAGLTATFLLAGQLL